MPVLLAVLAAVVVIGLYLWLCILAVQYLVVALAGWIAVIGATAGAAAALSLAGHAVASGSARLLGPDQVNDETYFRKHPSAYRRDPAWPHYLARQGRDDLAAAGNAVLHAIERTWAGAASPFKDGPGILLFWPLLLGVLIFLLAGTGGALVALAGFLVVTGLALGVALVMWGGFGYLVRCGDALLRRRNRARARCPVCFEVSDPPGYACACGVVHHDVRPSRIGVLWHRCRCGRPMPTTVSRAGAGRAPQCAHCHQLLEVGSGVWTDVSVPVFGAVSAGKTSLIYASLTALQDLVIGTGGEMEPRGAASERSFHEGVAQVRQGQVAKTSATTPVGLVTRVSDGKRQALLHTYDAAGEFFSSRDANNGMRFLDHAEQMIVVVDPFSIPSVADQTGRGAVSLDDAAPAAEPPEDAYRTTVLRVRDQGVRLDRVTLAVVVVKADLLVALPVGATVRPESGSVRAWLWENGQDQLVTETERDFARVGYFLVSSRTGLYATSRHSAAAPLRWLADSARLPLPHPVLRPDRTGEPA